MATNGRSKLRNPNWGAWLRAERKRAQVNRSQVAKAAGLDPGYITLLERGYVPRRDKVLAVARALQSDETCALLAAGYAPAQFDTKALAEGEEARRLLHSLTPSLRLELLAFVRLPEPVQTQASFVLHALRRCPA